MGLWADAKNIRDKDPAARNVAEVIILYPGFHVLVTHKIAHFLYCHKCFFLARLISQPEPRQAALSAFLRKTA